jgi:ABC-type cobalamin transport system permease subunit
MLPAVLVPKHRGETALDAGRTRMISFAMSKVALGLVISLLLVRLAVVYGTTSSIMLIAGIAIALFASAIFQTLTK